MTTTFHGLHQSGTFLLVNVHDAGTAALAQAAGAVALGTTSAGHAYSIGRDDGQGALSRDESLERVAQMCAVVDIPISVDAENGWGHTPDEVAATIRDLAEVGASGASIEDWSGDPERGFYDRGLAVERIAAAVEAGRSVRAPGGDPFVVCARAEAFLWGAPDPMPEAIARLQSFAEAGADCLYAPGIRDEAGISRIVTEAGGPVNWLLGVGGAFGVDDAARLGVRRVSVGGSLYRATMAAFSRQVEHMVTTGSLAADPAPISDSDISALFEQ